MAHIDLGVDERLEPGILGLLSYRPQTAAPLMALANILLHEPHSLTPGERELIAAQVSAQNECEFCSTSHAAFAALQLEGGAELVEQVRHDVEQAPISEKLRALLAIASAVRESGRKVDAEMVARAREAGATDVEIHDTVLIAAAFCMYNRYVDGLGTLMPEDPSGIDQFAELIVAFGYQPS